VAKNPIVTAMAVKKTRTWFPSLLKHSKNECWEMRLAIKHSIIDIRRVTIAIVATAMMMFFAKLKALFCIGFFFDFSLIV
jgi:hypothetical protein